MLMGRSETGGRGSGLLGGTLLSPPRKGHGRLEAKTEPKPVMQVMSETTSWSAALCSIDHTVLRP